MSCALLSSETLLKRSVFVNPLVCFAWKPQNVEISKYACSFSYGTRRSGIVCFGLFGRRLYLGFKDINRLGEGVQFTYTRIISTGSQAWDYKWLRFHKPVNNSSCYWPHHSSSDAQVIRLNARILLLPVPFLLFCFVVPTRILPFS